MPEPKYEVGLALSGGGARAAAFHMGTLKGLEETGLLGSVAVVSTVSGGSVLGAAWMAALARGEALDEFMAAMEKELRRGFIARTVRFRLFKTLLPGYTRTNALATTFDHALMGGLSLRDLPASPRLVMNTTVMNNGQVGKFSKEGFKAAGITPPGTGAASAWVGGLRDYPLSLAAAASAAFPVGLSPVYLKRGEDGVPTGWGATETLRKARVFALTDGGVLENLGIQTLLNPQSEFAARTLVASDAGCRERTWKPGGLTNRLRGFAMGAVSAPVLERVSVLMNDKEDRHTRHETFEALETSWLAEAHRNPAEAATRAFRAFLRSRPHLEGRHVLMVRLNQEWDHFVERIPRWRLVFLAEAFKERTGQDAPSLPVASDLPAKQAFLAAVGADLGPAKEIYRALGGRGRVNELNRVPTSFSALSGRTVADLALHARWQVHAARAVYWG